MTLITVFFCATLAAATPVAEAVADGNREMAGELFRAGDCIFANMAATEPRVENVISGGYKSLVLISAEVRDVRVYTWLPVHDLLAQELLGGQAS